MSKVSSLQRRLVTSEAPSGASRVTKIPEMEIHKPEPRHNWLIEFDGGGNVVSQQQVRRADLDHSDGRLPWVRLSRAYIDFVLEHRMFAGLVEVEVWLYAVAHITPRGVVAINHRKFARRLGLRSHATISRAIASLCDKGILTRTDTRGLYLLGHGAASCGRQNGRKKV